MNGQLALNLLLAASGGLQAAALALRAAGKHRAALWLAGSNAGLALGMALLFFIALAKAKPWEHLGPVEIAFVGVEAAAVLAAAVGLARRSASGWLFWPVWGWNFTFAVALLYGKLLLHVCA
jgi:hypothetical protein